MNARRAAVAMLVVASACGKSVRKDEARPPTPEPEAVCEVFRGADVEVSGEQLQVDLPAVPAFELPPPGADGSLSVRAMRVNGRNLFEQEVIVRGQIAMIYDCFTAVRANPEWADRSDAQIRKYIEEEPDRYCRKPLIWIADDAASGTDRAIKVVNVPRHPNKIEKKLLPKEELANTEIWRPVPPLKVGDEVVVTGTWTQRSPIGESDQSGLLLYGSLINVTQGWPKSP